MANFSTERVMRFTGGRGISVRDYLAGQILSGLCANPHNGLYIYPSEKIKYIEIYTKSAYEIVDEMEKHSNG